MFKWLKKSKSVEVGEITWEEKKVKNKEKLIQLAMVLSDNDKMLLEGLDLFVNEKYKELRNWIEDLKKPEVDYYYLEDIIDEIEEQDLENVVLELLISFGYVGANDWKFTLDDFIFNSEGAYQYYNIDFPKIEDLDNVENIVAPQVFQIMKENLPPGFGLALWDNLSDSFFVIIAPHEILEQAEALGKELDIKIEQL